MHQRIPYHIKLGCLLLCGSLLFIFGVLPFVYNLGTVLLMSLGILFICFGITIKKWERKRGFSAVFWSLFILFIIFCIVYTVIWNYFAFFRLPPQDSSGTVVVLGCKANDDTPSLMLRRRLEKALEYLQHNPMANCVVSGGQGENETYSEAYVMKKYLVDNGVDARRIYMEDRSTNTEENLCFSTQLIREQGLNQQMVICTDGFHQLRAYIYARKNGMASYAISGKTPFWVVPSYAVRELFALVKAIAL